VNRTLAKIVLDQIAFLELATDEEFQPDVALKLMESIGAGLPKVSLDDQRDLIAYSSELAKGLPAAKANAYRSLQEAMGLLEQEPPIPPLVADEVFAEFILYQLANYELNDQDIRPDVAKVQAKRIMAELKNLDPEARSAFVEFTEREAALVERRALGHYRELAGYFRSIGSAVWPGGV
jgi:hypothetical protein